MQYPKTPNASPLTSGRASRKSKNAPASLAIMSGVTDADHRHQPGPLLGVG